MHIRRIAVAVGMAVVLGAGLTACGEPYTGEGVVVSKDYNGQYKRYEITVDVPNADLHKVLYVSEEKYDTLMEDDTVNVEDGEIK